MCVSRVHDMISNPMSYTDPLANRCVCVFKIERCNKHEFGGCLFCCVDFSLRDIHDNNNNDDDDDDDDHDEPA